MATPHLTSRASEQSFFFGRRYLASLFVVPTYYLFYRLNSIESSQTRRVFCGVMLGASRILFNIRHHLLFQSDLATLVQC